MNLADDTAKLSLNETLISETNKQKPTSNGTNKRMDYLEWEDYFMANAMLAAQRSKDPCTQVGACIVNKNNRVVGIGYNGMPNRCNDDVFPWTKSPGSLDHKHLYVCHAELNAIMNKTSADVNDCTIYVTLFPCNECAKLIIQAGITEVVYLSNEKSDKLHFKASKIMFDAAKVTYRSYKPKKESISINYSGFFDQIASGQADQSP